LLAGSFIACGGLTGVTVLTIVFGADPAATPLRTGAALVRAFFYGLMYLGLLGHLAGGLAYLLARIVETASQDPAASRPAPPAPAWLAQIERTPTWESAPPGEAAPPDEAEPAPDSLAAEIIPADEAPLEQR
jgi:hypothetical protein